MVQRPQHGCAFLLIEHSVRVNEENLSVFLLIMLLPKDPHHVNTAFDTCLQSTTELLRPAGLLGFRPRHRQHALSLTADARSPPL